MAITKEIELTKIDSDATTGAMSVRVDTVVKEDGIELSRSFHRRVLTPEMDVSGEDAEIKGMAAALWTDEVKESWAEFQASQTP